MKIFYVIGEKSSKSLSPIIFNHWFKKYKIDAYYDFLEIKNNSFNKEIKKTLKQKNLLGLNITIPYKKKIIKFIDDQDKHSKNIGAVNCVVFKSGKTKGINTDWAGYKRSLKKIKIKKNEKIIILGYGGAGMAIQYSFTQGNFTKVLVFNRTKKLISNNNEKIFTKNFNQLNKNIFDARLIVNTTPLNILKPNQLKLIGPKTIVSDIVYLPKKTKFLKQFNNNKKIYGISMLLQQAILSFKNWFGFEPLVDYKLINKLEKKIK